MKINLPTHFIFLVVLLLLTSCGVIRINFKPSGNDNTTTYKEYRDKKAREFQLMYPGTKYSLDDEEYSSNDIEADPFPRYENNIANEEELQDPCLYNIAYVCGCDGVTYVNACIANRNGIYYYTMGSCEDKE